MSGFHGAFATGVASQQGTLTPPDTWFRPPFSGACMCSECWDRFSRLYTELMTVPNLTFTELRGFHGAFATGVASQQGALTLPDTWFRPPFWDLLMLQLLRPIPRTCHVFNRLFTSNTPWYFLDFAFDWLSMYVTASTIVGISLMNAIVVSICNRCFDWLSMYVTASTTVGISLMNAIVVSIRYVTVVLIGWVCM